MADSSHCCGVISWQSQIFQYNNNNINNYKTSIAPISPKRFELSGIASTGVGKTHSPGMGQSSSTMIIWKGNLGRISEKGVK